MNTKKQFVIVHSMITTDCIFGTPQQTTTVLGPFKTYQDAQAYVPLYDTRKSKHTIAELVYPY